MSLPFSPLDKEPTTVTMKALRRVLPAQVDIKQSSAAYMVDHDKSRGNAALLKLGEIRIRR